MPALKPVPARKLLPLTLDSFERSLVNQLAIETHTTVVQVVRSLIIKEAANILSGPLGAAAKRAAIAERQMQEIRAQHEQQHGVRP